MRQRLLPCVLLLLGAASCSKGTVESAGETPASVTFTTGFSSRSTIGNRQELAAAGGFRVWAYTYTGSWSANPAKTALFNNTAVTSSDNGASWSYGDPVYWPVNPVSFFAYAPAGSGTVGTPTADGVPVINFTVGATPAAQKDLLAATPQFDLSGSNHTGNIPVNIYFNHALSRVKFSAVLSQALAETVKVTKVEMTNIYNRGSIALQTPLTWDVTTSATTGYTLTVGSGLEDVPLTPASQNITSDGGVMVLLPQQMQRENDLPGMNITVTVDGVEKTFELPLFSPEAWLPGKSYEYQLYVDLETIRFVVIDTDIDLVDWRGSIMLQTVTLTSEPIPDRNNIANAVYILNLINAGTTGTDYYYPYFGIYGVNDVNHDITIDVGAMELRNFQKDQCLLFDFKKSIRSWGHDDDNNPWKVTVYHAPYWDLMPSQQNLPVDAVSGATGPASNVMTARGSIILKRNATPYP